MSDAFPPVQPFRFRPLPLRDIRPAGWLRNQLRIQADGLSGHLDEFWPDIQHSSWFGGTAEGWERGPYWLDGVLPLAFLLDDAPLKRRVTGYLDYIIAHQKEDGWLGPEQANTTNAEKTEEYDIWAFFLAMKVLAQYHAITGKPEALTAIERCCDRILDGLDATPLFNWGQYRWFEALIPIHYAHSITGNPRLVELAHRLHGQGFDWKAYHESQRFQEATPERRFSAESTWRFDNHVVNNAMALKGHGLWALFSDAPADRAVPAAMIENLDRFHGMATGVFTGDECLAGTNPLRGTELCAVAEYMYSLDILLAAQGDPRFGDRLERIAYNALPATFSPDMWSHQYDQQANQVLCSRMEAVRWGSNGVESNLFGLEPNFGCCTANLSQAWPKLAAHLWMETPDGGIAAAAYAPSTAAFRPGGVSVTVELDTEYPFRDTLRFRVTAASAVSFPLHLRIPAWAEQATLRFPDGSTATPLAGTFHIVDRRWEGVTEIELKLPMPVRVTRRHNQSVVVERGPLVYSLLVGDKWVRVNEDLPGRELPHADWEVHPTTPWNYALQLNPVRPEESLVFEERPVGDCPFSPAGAPVSVRAVGRRLPAWQMELGWAGDLPVSPVTSAEPDEEVRLVPYGCTNLRITEFPLLG